MIELQTSEDRLIAITLLLINKWPCTKVNFVNTVTINLLAGYHYLNLLNQLMAIRSLSSSFSHLRSGAFHIALKTHKTQHTQPRGWKKRRTNKHGLGWAPSTRREKFWNFSCILCFCRLLYLGEIPTQPPGMLTHPLTLADLASESTSPNSLLSSHLSLTITFTGLLLTAFFCWLIWDLAFLCLLPVSQGILCVSPLCGFHTKTVKGILWVALTYTNSNECTHIMPQYSITYKYIHPQRLEERLLGIIHYQTLQHWNSCSKNKYIAVKL